MKTKTWILIGVGVLVVGGLIWFAVAKSKEETPAPIPAGGAGTNPAA
jgi:uncharacterized membrane protein